MADEGNKVDLTNPKEQEVKKDDALMRNNKNDLVTMYRNQEALLKEQKLNNDHLNKTLDNYEKKMEELAQNYEQRLVALEEELAKERANNDELLAENETLVKNVSYDDDRFDTMANQISELTQLVKNIMPPSGLRNTNNPFGTTQSDTSSVSSTASVQSNSAYRPTGESTAVSGVICGIYERISNGRLFTWRDKLGEYKPISEAQFRKRFKNETLAGNNDNAFNQTNVSGVDIGEIKKARMATREMNTNVFAHLH